jgi:SHS2 domain-containing protein
LDAGGDHVTTDWEDVSGSSARVRHLDHTADVGVEIRASSLEDLLLGAVEGMTGLILGDARPEAREPRAVVAEGDDPALLLRNLLRELLYLHEADGFAVASATVRTERSGDAPLRAELEARGGEDPVPPDRELKGVTLHGLSAEEDGRGEWFARVIFDV